MQVVVQQEVTLISKQTHTLSKLTSPQMLCETLTCALLFPVLDKKASALPHLPL